MKTLLVIQAYAGANDQIHWSMPSYQLPGWDMIGIHPFNAKAAWPSGMKSFAIGRNSYIGPQLILRWLKTFEKCLLPEFNGYSDFCVIEYDCVFLRQSETHSGSVLTCKAVGDMRSAGLKSSFGGFHPPWWVDRAAAETILDTGTRLMAKGYIERGSPDMFMGLILERSKLPWHRSNTYSVNGGAFNQFPDLLEKSKARVKEGAWMVHGIRTQEQLNQLNESAKP